MVDAVRSHFVTLGISPAAFHYEKFTPTRIVTADGST
jgi:benzoate/toluate 1,2-dioxygenase reductase subunit